MCLGASFDNTLDALDGTFCSFEGGDDPDQDGIYPDPLPGGYQGAIRFASTLVRKLTLILIENRPRLRHRDPRIRDLHLVRVQRSRPHAVLHCASVRRVCQSSSSSSSCSCT